MKPWLVFTIVILSIEVLYYAAIVRILDVPYRVPVFHTVTTPRTITPLGGIVVEQAGPADIYPDQEVTPGMINTAITQATIKQTICNPNWSTKSERPSSGYTTSLKKMQLKSGYNYHSDLATKDYEEDHLISLELGGNPTNPKNLWPEPYHASISDGGAKNKDSVENYLHAQVCAGSMKLAEAQREISTDWYAVYVAHMKPGATRIGAIGTVGIDQDDQ